MAQKPDPRDPAAAAVFAVVTILGTLGLLTRWGLSADDVAQLVGAVMTLAAFHRAWKDRRSSPAAVVLATSLEVRAPEGEGADG